jgi:hypothetical protein
MRKLLFALAVALALPLEGASVAQVPARIDVDSLQPVAGSWSFHSVQGGSYAAFADTSGGQRIVIRCNRGARTVSILRTGVAAAAPTMSVWASSTARSIVSRYDSTRTLTIDLSATDPLLDAIAFSRGRFATAAAGAPMLIVPSGPQIDRVIEDCRS